MWKKKKYISFIAQDPVCKIKTTSKSLYFFKGTHIFKSIGKD